MKRAGTNIYIQNGIENIDREKWSNFLLNHPAGNIFQTSEFFNVYRETKNYEPIFLYAIDDKNDLLGILLSVIIKSNGGILGRFSSRTIIFGGPIVRENDGRIINMLLGEFNKIIKKESIYSQIRNFVYFDNKKAFLDNGYYFDEHLNIVIDLSKTEDELWKEVSQKRRNEIRKAQREGVKVMLDNSFEALRDCYQILKEVYRNARLPLASLEFFCNLKEQLSSNTNTKFLLFVAKYENKIIGCMLALGYKNVIYDFYAGALHQYYKKYSNDLIPWEIFLWGKKEGYTIFDFGGAGKPGVPYGVRDYKKQFGGELINWGRFQAVHKPKTFKVSKFIFELYQKIF